MILYLRVCVCVVFVSSPLYILLNCYKPFIRTLGQQIYNFWDPVGIRVIKGILYIELNMKATHRTIKKDKFHDPRRHRILRSSA